MLICSSCEENDNQAHEDWPQHALSSTSNATIRVLNPRRFDVRQGTDICLYPEICSVIYQGYLAIVIGAYVQQCFWFLELVEQQDIIMVM
jgi:hypothetical protein